MIVLRGITLPPHKNGICSSTNQYYVREGNPATMTAMQRRIGLIPPPKQQTGNNTHPAVLCQPKKQMLPPLQSTRSKIKAKYNPMHTYIVFPKTQELNP